MEKPSKNLKKSPAKKPKKTAAGGKNTQKPKATPRRNISSSQTINPKEDPVTAPTGAESQHRYLDILVPGLPVGRMNSMYNEPRNTGTISKIGWKLSGRSYQRKYLKGHKVG